MAFDDEDDFNEEEADPEELEMEQDGDESEPRVLSQAEIAKRNTAYGTIPRSQSELDLRAAAATPPPGGNGNTQKRKKSLLSVREEDSDDEAENYRHQNQKQNDKSGKGFSAKKMSMSDMGLVKSKYPTQFDDVDDDDEEDGDAPGAFKRPKSAFHLAKSDLKSKDWQSEIEGKIFKRLRAW